MPHTYRRCKRSHSISSLSTSPSQSVFSLPSPSPSPASFQPLRTAFPLSTNTACPFEFSLPPATGLGITTALDPDSDVAELLRREAHRKRLRVAERAAEDTRLHASEVRKREKEIRRTARDTTREERRDRRARREARASESKGGQVGSLRFEVQDDGSVVTIKEYSKGCETRTTVSVCWAKNVFPPRDCLAKAPEPTLAPADIDAEVDQDEVMQVLPPFPSPTPSPSTAISQASKSCSALPSATEPSTATTAPVTDDLADAWLSGLGIDIGPIPDFSPPTPSPPTPDIEPPLAGVAPEPTPTSSPPPASPTSSNESDLRAKVVESLAERKRIASAAAQLALARPPAPFFAPTPLFAPLYFTASPSFFPSPTFFDHHPFVFPASSHHAPQRTSSAPSSSPAAAPPVVLRRRSLESIPVVKVPGEPWAFPSGCVGDGVIEFSDDDDNEPGETARTDHLASTLQDEQQRRALETGELFVCGQ